MKFQQPYHSLIVWQRADEFVKSVYRSCEGFPVDERFAMVSQLKRAALSITLNIVEGQARKTPMDRRRFYFIARGSAAECAYILELGSHLGYLTEEQYNELEQKRREVSILLQRLIGGIH